MRPQPDHPAGQALQLAPGHRTVEDRTGHLPELPAGGDTTVALHEVGDGVHGRSVAGWPTRPLTSSTAPASTDLPTCRSRARPRPDRGDVRVR